MCVPILAGRTAWGCRFPSECCVIRTTSLTGMQSGLLFEDILGERDIEESLGGNNCWDSWTKSAESVPVCSPVDTVVGSLGWNVTAAKYKDNINVLSTNEKYMN